MHRPKKIQIDFIQCKHILQKIFTFFDDHRMHTYCAHVMFVLQKSGKILPKKNGKEILT